jgi:hypothetical protein|tara:strand:- start:9267 stop:9476 length:210 start_codon:yes stop_codon:yes gene_type:complete
MGRNGVNAMKEENYNLIEAAINKGIDEGMEQILRLLMQYNINDEEYLNDALFHLAYHSIVEDTEEVKSE